MGMTAPAPESEFMKFFRAGYEEGLGAWNEGDFKRAFSTLPEDLTYEPPSTWPNARPLHNRDQMVAFFEDLRETFPDLRLGSPEYIEVDERTMIAGVPVLGTGRSSGAGVGMEVWEVWEVGEGLGSLRIRGFPDRGAALEAAGAVERADD